MSIFDDCRPVSCVDAAMMLGISLKRNNGNTAWALCPMHGERGHPSLFFSANRGWYCYGCHRGGGDAVSLYQAMLGMEPLDAARQCANDFGIPVDDDYEPSLNVNARHLSSALHRRRDKLRSRLALELCDADDAIQRMIHNVGAEACAEDDRFYTLVDRKSALQAQLDQLLEADDMELLEIMKQLEGGLNEH